MPLWEIEDEAISDMIGGVVSELMLLTFTETTVEVLEFPAKSRAVAVKSCCPFETPAVFQVPE